jgi:hypothetical protein
MLQRLVPMIPQQTNLAADSASSQVKPSLLSSVPVDVMAPLASFTFTVFKNGFQLEETPNAQFATRITWVW